MNDNALIFLAAFFAALLWWRGLFWIWPGYFQKPLTRTALGLRWHHLHHGLVLVMVAAGIIVLRGLSPAAVVLLGLGLGFAVDEFTSFLFYETDREIELRVYRRSLSSTLVIFAAIGVVIFLLSLVL